MSTQHTPGPWTLDGRRRICDKDGITLMRAPLIVTGEDVANLLLATAAPELYDALDFALDVLEGDTPDYGCTCEACRECGEMPKDCTGTECALTCSCTECPSCRVNEAQEVIRAALAKARGEA